MGPKHPAPSLAQAGRSSGGMQHPAHSSSVPACDTRMNTRITRIEEEELMTL